MFTSEKSPAGLRPLSQFWTAAIAEATWISAKRTLAYSRILIAVYAVSIVCLIFLSSNWIDPAGKPVGTDFLNVWSAGRMALAGDAANVYDESRQAAVQQAAFPWKGGVMEHFYGWHYPPIFILVAAGLALLPYGAALGVWLAATIPAYIAAVRAALQDRSALLPALAFPAVLVNIAHGQNGFLTAGLFGALLAVDRAPVSAGILLGLLAYKPQFAMLIPLALIAGRRWRALAYAAATTIACTLISLAFFGLETWHAFFNSLGVTRTNVLENGAVRWERLQSAFAAVRMLGGGIGPAYGAQAVFATIGAAVALWLWTRDRVSIELKTAALVTAAVMTTPYVLDYDLIVLALPVACVAAVSLRDGFMPYEKFVLFAAWMLPLVSRGVAYAFHIPSAPATLLLLLWIILRRARASTDLLSTKSSAARA